MYDFPDFYFSEFYYWGTDPILYIRQERPTTCDDTTPDSEDNCEGYYECSIYDDYRLEKEVRNL